MERVIYYSAYIITEIKEENRKQALDDLDRELKGKLKTVGNKDKTVKGEIEDAADHDEGLSWKSCASARS